MGLSWCTLSTPRLLGGNVNKLIGIYLESTRPTKLFTVLLMTVCALGLVIGHDEAATIKYLNKIAPDFFWALLFLLMAVMRIVELFADKTGVLADYFVPITVIWVWAIILTASVIAVPFNAMGLLYLIPILVEMWFISRAVEDKLERFKRNIRTSLGP